MRSQHSRGWSSGVFFLRLSVCHPRDTILATRLRDTRRSAEMTWDQVAKKSGYSWAYVRDLAYGTRTNPTIGAVKALADTLGVEPEWLAGWKD